VQHRSPTGACTSNKTVYFPPGEIYLIVLQLLNLFDQLTFPGLSVTWKVCDRFIYVYECAYMNGARDSEMHFLSTKQWSSRAPLKNLTECSAQRFYNFIVKFNYLNHMQSTLYFTVCVLLYILFLTLLSDVYYAKLISLLNLNCI
jgi:hypothetical protein